jgi:tRNA(Arg) A34 adenosine deaminase TadA
MKEFTLARKYAVKPDNRNYIFGAVAVRSDGTMVFSRNIPNYNHNHRCHAETRITRKCDIGATVWVVRVARDTGFLMNARPCRECEKVMRMAGIRRCWYSITEIEYGVLNF